MQPYAKFMFNQISAQKGIILFGERVVVAMFKEMKQLGKGTVPRKIFVRDVYPTTLTKE